jgi:hypothetical protein
MAGRGKRRPAPAQSRLPFPVQRTASVCLGKANLRSPSLLAGRYTWSILGSRWAVRFHGSQLSPTRPWMQPPSECVADPEKTVLRSFEGGLSRARPSYVGIGTDRNTSGSRPHDTAGQQRNGGSKLRRVSFPFVRSMSKFSHKSRFPLRPRDPVPGGYLYTPDLMRLLGPGRLGYAPGRAAMPIGSNL